MHHIDKPGRSVGLADAVGGLAKRQMIEPKSAMLRLVEDTSPSDVGEGIEVLARKPGFAIIAIGIGSDDLLDDAVEPGVQVGKGMGEIVPGHRSSSKMK